MAVVADLEKSKMYTDIRLIFVKKCVDKSTLLIRILQAGIGAEREKMGIITSKWIGWMDCIAGVNDELVVLAVFSQAGKGANHEEPHQGQPFTSIDQMTNRSIMFHPIVLRDNQPVPFLRDDSPVQRFHKQN
jgi:hypothetical protein